MPAQRLDALDIRLTRWMAAYGPTILRIALGIVFFWFGVLKFFPGLSPADDLATRTIRVLTFGLVEAHISRPVLAAWETAIALGLFFGGPDAKGLVRGWLLRATLLLLAVQMLGTFTPLVLFPAETWRRIGIVPTLEGQYIIKNVVLVAAALVIGATVRDRRPSERPS